MISPAGDPANQRVAVLAIGRHDAVVLAERVQRTNTYGFLPDVEVQEPPDLLLRIELGALLLESANADHVPQQLEDVVT